MSVGASDSSQPAQGIFLSDGLAGHDHRAMELMYMFELARPQHPDILSGYPFGPEFFAFVDQARFFGVIIDAGVVAPENNWGEDVWEPPLGIEPQGLDLPTLGFVYLLPAGPESERHAYLDVGDATADMMGTGEAGATPGSLLKVAPHLNLGIYLSPAFHRGEKEMASLRRALDEMLRRVFMDLERSFTAISQGFREEGTRLGAFYDPLRVEWRDELTMGLCATDFLVPRTRGTMWDALLARHAREQEELLRQEQRQPHVVRRSSSLETVRMINDGALSAVTSRASSAAPSRASSVSPSRASSVAPSRASSVVASRGSSPLPWDGAATPDMPSSTKELASNTTFYVPPEMDSADGYNDWSPGSFYDAHNSPGTENEWLLSDFEGSVPETASVSSYDMMSDLD
ncbi:hypothetical protein K525DRAFT_290962 [Schizophyllum commune Loenen D]|nr:hypothetical protein K525DRAFT_290962 [Schizophyllum commune Loenen D]